MIKTQKIALDPNRDQIAWFYQQCGYAKFAYNSALSNFKTELASDNFLSMYDLNKRFNKKKKAFDWTKAQDQRAAMYAVHNLGCAIDNWKAKRAKFPRLKKPSSRTCSACGYKKDDLPLSDRQYHCNRCGTSIDRDVNAAINLRTLAAGYTES